MRSRFATYVDQIELAGKQFIKVLRLKVFSIPLDAAAHRMSMLARRTSHHDFLTELFHHLQTYRRMLGSIPTSNLSLSNLDRESRLDLEF